MIELVYIGSNTKTKTAVEKLVRKLDFLYEDELKINFCDNTLSLDDTLASSDIIKIFIVEAKYYGLIKCIRNKDLNSEIILLKDDTIIIDKCYHTLKRIYATVSIKRIDLLERNIDDLINAISSYKTFKYKNRDMDLNICLDNILYIYRDTRERKIVVVTNSNKYKINMSLKDAINYLDSRFKQVHRACIVNTKRIEMYNWCSSNFVLDNGLVINMLSKKYKDEF